jgi:ubiquitin fusion degradation protein 1
MEKQLLAVGWENYSNYIKLPESVLTEFVQPKNSNSLVIAEFKNKKNKGINLRDQLKSSSEVKIQPPYYFSIESEFGKFTYCGVLDFTAEEGLCMLPYNIMTNLDIFGSDFVTVRYIGNVPKGDFVQLEPIEKDIFDIPELDKFLERTISNYCLLYPDQIITCIYNNNQYSIIVKSIKSVCEFDAEPELIDVVNTDLKIDIYNRFLEEELREKERINEEIVEAKRKELEIAQQKEQQTKQNSGFTNGTGIRLGGEIETVDPALMRELRLQNFLALQAKQIKPDEPTEKTLIQTVQQVKPKSKTNKKSKEIEV